MNTLNFNDADLKANREGRLSDAQQKRLDTDVEMIQRHSRYMLWFIGITVTLLAVGGMISEFRKSGQDLNALFSPPQVTGVIVMIVMFGFLFLIAIGSYWWSMRGLTQGAIRTVEGTAEVISTFTTVRGMRVPLNRVRLRRSWYSRFTFHFQDKESLRYFKNGTRYRVYYLPYAMPQALSAEEIKPEKPKR